MCYNVNCISFNGINLMKILAIITFFLLSPIVNAASFNILTGNDINDFDGTLTSTWDENSISLNYPGPALFISDVPYFIPAFYNTNEYLISGNDIYHSPMGGFLTVDFLKNVKVKFEWFSNNIAQGSFSSNGGGSQMISGLNGMLITNIAMGVSTIGFSGLANSLDSNMGLKLTVLPSEVPLPAAFWLFLPSLLGLMGFRKFSNKKSVSA